MILQGQNLNVSFETLNQYGINFDARYCMHFRSIDLVFDLIYNVFAMVNKLWNLNINICIYLDKMYIRYEVNNRLHETCILDYLWFNFFGYELYDP